MRQLLFWSVLLVPLSCQAGVYVWTDANGQKHFSDSAPPGVAAGKASQQNLRSAQTVQSSEEAQGVRERQAAAAKKMREDDDKSARAASAAASAEHQKEGLCHALQSREKFLQSGGRFFTTDASGQTHYYSDAELDQQRQTLQQQLQANGCD